MELEEEILINEVLCLSRSTKCFPVPLADGSLAEQDSVCCQRSRPCTTVSHVNGIIAVDLGDRRIGISP